jgi:hypothetical protein
MVTETRWVGAVKRHSRGRLAYGASLLLVQELRALLLCSHGFSQRYQPAKRATNPPRPFDMYPRQLSAGSRYTKVGPSSIPQNKDCGRIVSPGRQLGVLESPNGRVLTPAVEPGSPHPLGLLVVDASKPRRLTRIVPVVALYPGHPDVDAVGGTLCFVLRLSRGDAQKRKAPVASRVFGRLLVDCRHFPSLGASAPRGKHWN